MENDNKMGEGKKDQLVTVTVDGAENKIAQGTYVVKELKEILGIEPNRELLEIKGKKMKPLTDDEKTHIEGGEVFVTHVSTGASS